MPIKVEKVKHKVVILLDNMKVTGNIHTMPRSRLTDILNSVQVKDFIPITDASVEIYSTNQKEHTDLIEINKNKIHAIYPEEDNI